MGIDDGSTAPAAGVRERGGESGGGGCARERGGERGACGAQRVVAAVIVRERARERERGGDRGETRGPSRCGCGARAGEEERVRDDLDRRIGRFSMNEV